MSKLEWTAEEKRWLAQVDWSKAFLLKLMSDSSRRFVNPEWEHRSPGQRICAAVCGYDNMSDYDPRVRKALRDRISKAKRPKKVLKKWSVNWRFLSREVDNDSPIK